MKNLPEGATKITRYAELTAMLNAFATGYLGFVLLTGPPGVGKSRQAKQTLGNEAAWIEGNASAFGIYEAAFNNRDQPLVFEDIDGLYSCQRAVRLLKALCQTDQNKTVGWWTKAAAGAGLPSQFSTSSSVLLISNVWKDLNPNTRALVDRAHVFSFQPETTEIYRYVASWFWDQAVFDFVGNCLHLVQCPSARLFVKAAELRKAGLDWQATVLSQCFTGKTLAVAKLKTTSFVTEEARAQAFQDAGHGSRRTYFRHMEKIAEKITPKQPLPKIAIQGTHPRRSPTADLESILRRRFGRLGNG